MVSDIPEELLEIFPDDGKPGSKKPKDKVCISFLYPFSKWLKVVSRLMHDVACEFACAVRMRRNN